MQFVNANFGRMHRWQFNCRVENLIVAAALASLALACALLFVLFHLGAGGGRPDLRSALAAVLRDGSQRRAARTIHDIGTAGQLVSATFPAVVSGVCYNHRSGHLCGGTGIVSIVRIALLSFAIAGSALAQGTRPVPNLSPDAPSGPNPKRDQDQPPGSDASDELADPKTGCRIVRADTEPNVSISWSGDCYHGLANGSGALQWFQSGKPIARYEGDMSDGLANGHGTITYANGSRYEGDWVNGERYGRGTFVFANGARYVGDFRDNKPNGRGTYVWPNGNRYVGDFRDNLRTGRGTLYYANGDRYEGEFVNGKAQGRGLRTYATGGRYDGEWRNDLPNGYGTRYAADGQNYSGNWQNGCFREGSRWATIGVTAQQCGFQ